MNSPADREDITGDIGQRVGRLKDAQCDMETRMFVTEYDTRALKQKAAATARKVEELDTAVSGLVAHATVQDRLPVEASNANQEQPRPRLRPSSKLKLHARQRAPLEAPPERQPEALELEDAPPQQPTQPEPQRHPAPDKPELRGLRGQLTHEERKWLEEAATNAGWDMKAWTFDLTKDELSQINWGTGGKCSNVLYRTGKYPWHRVDRVVRQKCAQLGKEIAENSSAER